MADLPCPCAPEGQGLSLPAVQPRPHDGLASTSPHTNLRAPLKGRRCCPSEAWASPRLLKEGA